MWEYIKNNDGNGQQKYRHSDIQSNIRPKKTSFGILKTSITLSENFKQTYEKPGPKIIGLHTNIILGIVLVFNLIRVLTGFFNDVIMKKDNNTVEKPC